MECSGDWRWCWDGTWKWGEIVGLVWLGIGYGLKFVLLGGRIVRVVWF